MFNSNQILISVTLFLVKPWRYEVSIISPWLNLQAELQISSEPDISENRVKL